MPARYFLHFFGKAAIAERSARSLVLSRSLDRFYINGF